MFSIQTVKFMRSSSQLASQSGTCETISCNMTQGMKTATQLSPQTGTCETASVDKPVKFNQNMMVINMSSAFFEH